MPWHVAKLFPVTFMRPCSAGVFSMAHNLPVVEDILHCVYIFSSGRRHEFGVLTHNNSTTFLWMTDEKVSSSEHDKRNTLNKV